MTAIPASPTASPTDLVTLTLKVDGSDISPEVQLTTVDVSLEVGRIPSACVVLHDGDVAEQDFALSGGETLKIGATLEILAGYHSEEKVLFKGVITSHRIVVRRDGASTLEIRARDAAFRMTLERRCAFFEGVTDSDLFEELIRAHEGLRPEVDPTTTMHDSLVQYQTTDWDLLVSRAERLGLACLVESGTVRVTALDPGVSAAVSVGYGADVRSVDLRMEGQTQFAQADAGAWSSADQARVDSSVTSAPEPAHGSPAGKDLALGKSLRLRHSGALDQSGTDAWAAAALARSRQARIRGVVRIQGTHAPRPGGTIELSGLGERFTGTALVSGVRHQIGAGDWVTTVQVGLDPRWHHERYEIDPPRASGLGPSTAGLQIGVVTQLAGDPAGEHRIRVRLPAVDSADDGAWCRVATLDAGDQRGSFFLPELDDEVVVGFLESDPNQPVVLGMLHSSAKPAPIAATDDNHEKGLVTRSKIKILVDDSVPSITIQTEGGHALVLDDGAGTLTVNDSNGNSITMDSGGIAIESAGAVAVTAGGDATVEGVNVKATATASFEASGSGGAKLSSSGSTEVKGSVVQIN